MAKEKAEAAPVEAAPEQAQAPAQQEPVSIRLFLKLKKYKQIINGKEKS